MQLRWTRGPFRVRNGLGGRAFEGQQRLQCFVPSFERTFEFGFARQLFPAPLELQGRDPVGKAADVHHTSPRFSVLDAHGGGMGSSHELAIVLAQAVIHIHGGAYIRRSAGRGFQQVHVTGTWWWCFGGGEEVLFLHVCLCSGGYVCGHGKKNMAKTI